MKRTKYTPQFKEEAVKQVIDKGHTEAWFWWTLRYISGN